MTAHAYQNPADLDAGQSPTTSSNVVPFRPDQQPDAPSKRDRGDSDSDPGPKHYLAPVAKLDILFAKDIDPDLSPMARRVLTVILAHRNKDTGEAFPGEDEIARILGTTRRQSITDAVTELVKAGWITKDRKRTNSRKGSDYGSNHYTVLMDKVAAILAKAGISFTKGRHKAEESGTVLREDAEDLGTVSRETNARFCVADDNGKPCHNQPTEPAKVNPPKEPKGSLAAAQQADTPAASPSSRKIELPEDFQPDPVAVKDALDKGCTPAQIEQSLGIWRGKNAGKRFTLAEWTRRASAWLKIEKPGAKPAPDTMGTLLPVGWKPEERMIEMAMERGLTQSEVDAEDNLFGLHHRTVSGLKALSRDWNQSWGLWIERAAERKRQTANRESTKRKEPRWS